MKIAVVGALPHELKPLLKRVKPQRRARTDTLPTAPSKSHSKQSWYHRLGFMRRPRRQRGADADVLSSTSRRATQRQRRYTLEGESVYHATYLSHEIMIVTTGIGMRNAEEALTWSMDAFNPDLLLSIGFAGALYEGARVGDLVMATSVSLVSGNAIKTVRIPDERGLLDGLGGSTGARAGSFFTLETLTEKKAVKPLLPTDAAFPVCDMETFPLAEIARQRQLSFLAVRSITDLADEEIPPQFLEVTDRFGRYQFMRAAGLLLHKPQLIPMAAKLATRSRKASKSLWHAFDALVRLL